MPATVTLEQFSGPLDMLLQLIEQEELPITEVSLSRVTEQYVSYLEQLPDKSDELADFLVIAARLVYIKSRTLLPYLLPDEEDNGADLARQLKLYKQFVDASRDVQTLWNRRTVGYPHGEFKPPVVEYVLPGNVTPQALHDSLVRLVLALAPLVPLPQMTLLQTMSVHEVVRSLAELLAEQRTLQWNELAGPAAARSHVIVHFLAVLELVKSERADAEQPRAYADFSLSYVAN